MTTDTKRLRELAAAASPGPWSHADAIAPRVYLYSNPASAIKEPWERVMLGETYADGAGQGRRNLAFIAAANPQTVIALCEEVERLRESVDAARSVADRWQRYFTDTPGVAAANAEIVSLRLQLAAMTAARDEACDLLDGIMRGSPRIAAIRTIGAK